MGFLDTMFGGGVDIPPRSKMKNLDIVPDEFMRLRQPLADMLSGATSGKSQLSLAGIPDAPIGVAGMTGQESDLLSRLFGRAGADVPRAGLDGVLASIGAGNTALQRGGEAGILDTIAGKFLGPDSNPWLKATADAAAGDLQYDWENRIMPNLRTSFTGKGHTVTPGSFGSSAFDRAGALAANEQTRQMRDLVTELYGQNYQQERSRMLEALGLGQQETGQRAAAQSAGLDAQRGEQAQNLAERQAQTQELVTTLQAVALPRMIEQMGLDKGTEEFRNQLNQLMQLLGLQASVSGVSAAEVMPAPQQGIFGDVLAGLGGAAAAIARSDRRLKRDIVPLGASIFGIPLYEYRYLWSRARTWGVMADEAPAAARIVLPDGYLAVNYAMLGA